MDEMNSSSQMPVPPAPQLQSAPSAVCPVCHAPIKPEYYFCPNCGANLRIKPLQLATDGVSQFLLYGFSIVLPFIAYLAITKWQGIKYIRSDDPKAKQMGYIALILLIISSVFVIWWTTVQIQSYINSSVSDFNTNFSGL